jgi:hypothetical protein
MKPGIVKSLAPGYSYRPIMKSLAPVDRGAGG